MDGNFSAQHLASRVPENNINFTDGLGYFSKSDDYEKYLKRSKDDQVRNRIIYELLWFLTQLSMTGNPPNVTLTGQRALQENPGIPNMTSRALPHVHVHGMGSFLQEVQQIYTRVKGESTVEKYDHPRFG